MKLQRLADYRGAFSPELTDPAPEQSTKGFSTSQGPKLGVALGGGFARGLAHVGVLKVLEAEGIRIDFVAGTSVGAVIGACYCAGMSSAELEEIALMIHFSDFARWTLSRYGFCSNERLTQFCASVLRANTFEQLKIPLAITATDLCNGEAVVFTKGPLFAPMRASCAYPGMFLPVEIDDHFYIDGMFAYPVPTTPLRHMGAERIVGVYLSEHGTQRRPRHLFEVIDLCFAIAKEKMSESWMRDADLVIEPEVNGFSYDCFDRAKELIAMGEKSMRSALPQLRNLLKLPNGMVEAEPIDLPCVTPPLVGQADSATRVSAPVHSYPQD